MTSDQREFYYATYDDDSADSLNSAIALFDRAVRACAGNELVPTSLMFANTGYNVRFITKNGEVEHQFAADNDSFIPPKEYSELADIAPALKLLTDAINAFHQARTSKPQQ